MNYKYRVLLVLILTVLIFCFQTIFGQSKRIQKTVTVKDNKLNVALNYLQPDDCLTGPGSIDINVSGGHGKYTYAWTNSKGFTSTLQDITGLQAGIYTLTVSDESGCIYNNSWEVTTACTNTCNLSETHSIINSTGCSVADGSITIAISGGSGNYGYAWLDENLDTLVTTKNLAARLPGAYVLFVQDLTDINCNKYFYFSIVSNFKVSCTTTNSTTCKSPYGGSIKAVVTGGSGNYSYAWIYPNGAVKNGSSTLSGIHGGSYKLTILDNISGCSLQQQVYVFGSGASLIIDGTTQASTACAPANGSVDVTVNNGSGNYLYTWFDQSTSAFAGSSEDLVNAGPGQYNVFVSDSSSGCMAFRAFTIDNNVTSYPSFTSTITNNTSCAAPYNGNISIASTGVNGPFNYTWKMGVDYNSSAKDITDLEAGDYTLTVTDQVGCTASSILSVEDNSMPDLSITVDKIVDVDSCTSPNGQIQVSVDAHTAYALSWTGPNNFTAETKTLRSLSTGAYIVTATIMCNRAPVISPPELSATDQSVVSLSLLDFITDADNNLDASTMAIVEKPISGADARIENNGALNLNYKGISFTGSDEVKIKVCDSLNACTQKILTIEVTSDDIIVYNAISANQDDLNKYMRIENIDKHPAKVSIYNRWGDAVFEADDYRNDLPGKRFEGISTDGKELPTGTYFYKIDFTDNTKSITGYLTLKY